MRYIFRWSILGLLIVMFTVSLLSIANFSAFGPKKKKKIGERALDETKLMCVKNLKASVLSFVSLPCSCWCCVVKFKYSYSVLRDKGFYKGDTSSLHVNLNKQICCGGLLFS